MVEADLWGGPRGGSDVREDAARSQGQFIDESLAAWYYIL